MKKQSCFTVVNREDYIRFITACVQKGINIDGTHWDFDLHFFAFLVDWDKMTCRNDLDWRSKGQDLVLYTPDSFLIEHCKSILYAKNTIDEWIKNRNLDGSLFWIQDNKLHSNLTLDVLLLPHFDFPLSESIVSLLNEHGEFDDPELADDLDR